MGMPQTELDRSARLSQSTKAMHGLSSDDCRDMFTVSKFLSHGIKKRVASFEQRTERRKGQIVWFRRR